MQPAENGRLLRLPQIIGQEAVTDSQAAANRQSGKGPKRPRPAIPALIPLSRSSWWSGVASGRFPAPLKIGMRATAWRHEEVIAAIASLGAAKDGNTKPGTKPYDLSSKKKVGAHV